MEIIGKEFRCLYDIILTSEVGFRENYYAHDGYYYIHIYDEKLLFISSGRKERSEIIGDFGKLNLEQKNIRMQNLKKLFKNDFHPAASHYQIKNETIMIAKKNNFEKEVEIIFKGKILLEGDAIKGAFYVKGEQTVPTRVYYNLDKPLPNPLIPEDDEEIV